MTRHRSKTHSGSGQPRPARRIHKDTEGKLPEPAACPKCGASYHNGRWTWKTAPVGSYEHVCPACERIEADYPAGVLHIGGAFAAAHRDEILGLLRNVESAERDDHPLNRIMNIEDEESGLLVSVTDANLTESLGHALERAYAGQLERPPTTSEKENLVRVRWTRD
jgi:NMD protein affecting ribosome stability and mRNA decay